MAVNGKQEPRVPLFRQGLGWPGVSKPRGPPAPAGGLSKRDSPFLPWNVGTGPGPGWGDTPPLQRSQSWWWPPPLGPALKEC